MSKYCGRKRSKARKRKWIIRKAERQLEGRLRSKRVRRAAEALAAEASQYIRDMIHKKSFARHVFAKNIPFIDVYGKSCDIPITRRK